MNPTRKSSFLRANPRAYLFIALLLGGLGVARVSNAQSSTGTTQYLYAALVHEGDSTGQVSAVTSQGQLEAAIQYETSEANSNSGINIATDLNFVFSTLSQSVGVGDFQTISNDVFGTTNATGAALANLYQQVAYESTASNSNLTNNSSSYPALEIKEGIAYDMATTAVADGQAAEAQYIALGDVQNDSSASDDALIAEETAYPLYAKNNATDNSYIAGIYGAAGSLQTTVSGDVTIAKALQAYTNYSSEAPAGEAALEGDALNQGTYTAALSTTQSFLSNLQAASAPSLATETGAYLHTQGNTTPAGAVGAAAANDDPQQATVIAADLIGAADPTINGSTAASVISITGSIASAAPAHASYITDSVLETIAQNAITLSPSVLDSGVAGAVANYFPQTTNGDADRAAFASAVATQVTTGGNTLYADVPAIAVSIATTLQTGYGGVDPNFGADEGAIAVDASMALYTAGQVSNITNVAAQVAGIANNTLATQVALATAFGNNGYFSTTSITNAVDAVEEVSLQGTVAAAPVTSATDYATSIPAYAPTIASTAYNYASSQSIGLSGSIGVAVDEVANVASSSVLSGSVASAVATAVVSGPKALSVPDTNLAANSTAANVNPNVNGQTGAYGTNDELYVLAEKFASASGNSAGNISFVNDESIATGLAAEAQLYTSNGHLIGTDNNDVIAAIASALTTKMTSISTIEQTVYNLVVAYPNDGADIVGSVIATLPAGLSSTAYQQDVVSYAVDAYNQTGVGVNGLTQTQEDNDVTAAYNIDQTANDGRYDLGVGLVSDETPVVDM